MLALNYRLFPNADFDMGELRDRIPSIGARFDGLPGLRLKAFLFRTGDVNEYAPFYLWNDTDAAAAFLWSDGGFAGVATRYGRPAARTWLTAAVDEGPVSDVIRWAVRSTDSLSANEPLEHHAARLRARVFDAHTTITAIDPATWEAVTLTLHTERPMELHGDLYEVPYLSRG